MILWRPTRPPRTNTKKKDVLFIIGNWNAKVGNQVIPGITGNFGLRVQNEAGQQLTVLGREHTGHSKHPLPTTQETTLHMDITRWSILKSDWLYSLQPKMEKLYTFSKNKTWSWLWLRSWTPYCKIQTEIEESRKTSKPFRYDLNQISCNYVVEVMNRFKGLDLVDRVPEELWAEVSNIQEAVTKTIAKKKKCKKTNWASEEALQIAEKRWEAKGKEERKEISNWKLYMV